MTPSVSVTLSRNFPTVRVSERLPATASYHVAYTNKRSWQTDNWWVALQTYDARHAYVYLMEIYNKQAIRFGLDCLRRDLHWLYPLSGEMVIDGGRTPLRLSADEHIRVLSASGEYEIAVQPGRHLLFSFALEWGWTRRYARTALSYLRSPVPVPINAAIRGQLLTLANLSPQEGLLMDAQIYWPIARITHATRKLYGDYLPAEKAVSSGISLARSVREHIQQDLKFGNKPLTITQIATHFGVTPDYLSRVHKKHYGLSLHAFQMQQRLAEAYRLLTTEGLSVSAVAYRLDFSDLSAFGKLFRKRYGLSPIEVRKAHGF